MAGGNPFMPPGSSLPTGMPGANPAGPVPGGPMANALASGGMGPDPNQDPANQPATGMQTGQGQGNGQTPPGVGGQPLSLEQVGKMLTAQFNEGVKNQRMLNSLRTELDQLIEYGDMVRPEQVIEAAGRLVGHGIGATDLAQIMSDMPAVGGEGLAGWLRMHDLAVTQMEQGLQQQNNLTQHHMSMIGMRMLVQQHVNDRIDQHVQAAQQAVSGLSGLSMSSPGSPPGGNTGGMSGNDLSGGGGGNGNA